LPIDCRPRSFRAVRIPDHPNRKARPYVRPLACVWRALALAALVTTNAAAQTARTPDSTALRVSGYMQPRFQAVGDSASFILRRARFAIEAKVTPAAFFRAQVEMRTVPPSGSGQATVLFSATDLYVRMARQGWSVTVGQFRVPFALEAITSSSILETTERSLIVLRRNLRDIGVQVEWRAPDRLILQGAVVNGEGPNRLTNPDNRMDYLGRVVLTPVAGWGVGGAVEAHPDTAGWNLQTLVHRGRFRTRAEYIRVHDRRTAVDQVGWYALAAYAVRPERLQLIGRVQQFDPSNRVATDRETGYGLGAQYFIHGDDLKLMGDYNYFREQVTQRNNDVLVVQMQVRW